MLDVRVALEVEQLAERLLHRDLLGDADASTPDMGLREAERRLFVAVSNAQGKVGACREHPADGAIAKKTVRIAVGRDCSQGSKPERFERGTLQLIEIVDHLHHS